LIEIAHKYNQATKYLEKGNYKKALPIFKQVLREFPCKEAYTNIGNCYRGLGQDKEMFESYKKALDDNIPILEPGSETVLHAMNNLGLAYYMYGDDESAIHYYTKAIKIKPDFWEAWWNCSTAMLRKASSGELDLFPKAWEMYKARFLKSSPVKLKNKKENLVYWDTVSSGDSIVILTEQGIGDNIMWGRYLPLVAEKFKKVYVQCDVSLEPIFSDYICVRDAVETDATVAYPICSLSECFPEIPAGDWLKGKFGVKEFSSNRPNVGIVWNGSSTHANNKYRSIPIGYFHNLSEHCNLFSLDPTFKGNKYVKPLAISSWTDTAEYINGLDLVIGVDTSVMHLCGSLGRPGWLLQPYKETDFRWGKGVKQSVWYSSIEIFENNQNWEKVFEEVKNALCRR
jgi:Tetratricopeptide repeat